MGWRELVEVRNKERNKQAATGRTALKMDEKHSGLSSQWACVKHTLTHTRKRSQTCKQRETRQAGVAVLG